MPVKKIFETPEEAVKYVEELRQKNRERAKKYYNEIIKSNPEKHKQHLEKMKQKHKQHDKQKHYTRTTCQLEFLVYCPLGPTSLQLFSFRFY